jgi:hypothetical protein
MNHRITIPAAALIGFLAGFAAHRSRDDGSSGETETAVRAVRPSRNASAAPVAAGSKAKVAPALKSSDTLDGLLALEDPGELYDRLALWQLDAKESELAAFWSGYRTREKRDTEVLDLLFSQWTRKNPRAAIEAAKGSGHEGIPWWAWAIHDPDAALAAARGDSTEMGGFVMRAVGQFHPDRAQRLLEENPGFSQWNSIEGIVNGLTRNDPEAALEFQRTHDRMDTKAIEKWTRDDPQAALEWLNKQAGGNDHYSSYSAQAFIRTLERETPERLAELAATAPSGELKWKLESAAFRHLATEDPAAALTQARAAESPRLAAERFAVIGRGLVESDPQGALDVFQELFKACPDATNRSITTRYPNGASSSGGGMVEGVREFITDMASNDPQALMAAATPREDPNRSLTGTIARAWASQDLEGFGKWVDGQQTGPAYDQGAVIMSEHLSEQEEFGEALDWATRVTDPNYGISPATQVFQNWLRKDREAAIDWFERTEVSDDLRKNLERYLPRE